MQQAVLAIEDRRFYEHPGVDPIGILGAVVSNLRGKHAYTYSEGVKMEPMREDGRRCLQPSDVGLTPRRPWALA